MWDLPRPGLEPVSPALAGGFLTPGPPGKSLYLFLEAHVLIHFHIEQEGVVLPPWVDWGFLDKNS